MTALTIGERIAQELAADPTKNASACAAHAGLSKSAMSELINGRSKSSTKLDYIAEYLGVSTRWLETGKGPKSRSTKPISNGEDTATYPAPALLRQVPIRGTAAVDKDGYWIELETGNGPETFAFPTSDPDAYGVQIKGDNYDPAIQAGECVLVEPGVELRIDGRVLLKLKDGRSAIFRLRTFDKYEYKFQSIVSHDRVTFDATDVEYVHFVRGNFSLHGL